MPAADRYVFEGFILEPAQMRLSRSDGSIVELSPRLFDALRFFVERAGELLTKDALFDSLWPGLVVEENNLNQVVYALRRALGDDGNRFIQTVPRRGFRFVAAVSVNPSTAAPPAMQRNAPHMRRRAVVAGTLGSAVAVAAGWWVWGRSRVAPAAHVTVAVLPFRPLGTVDDEILGLGMADSLASRLSLVSGLVVRSTSSVLPFRGVNQDSMHAARALEVDWIVDGSLQRQGDRLRTTARLLRTRDGTTAWSGSFDQRVQDVFDVQDQMAGRLAVELAPALRVQSNAPAGPLAQAGGTRNVEAYELYVQAAARAPGGRPGDTDEAIALLNRALSIDPSYAIAWTQLAWVNRRRLWNSDAVPADVFRAHNEALDRAIALVPGLPQARAGQAFGRYWFDFDWDTAEREFRGVLAVNPSEVSSHHGLALLLVTQDRIEEGLMHVRLARELDPLNAMFHVLEGSYLVDDGRLDQARLRIARALELAPRLWLAHIGHALLLFAEQRDDDGLAALRRAVEHARGTVRANAMLGVHLARTGRHDGARSILAELQAVARRRFVPPTSMAAVQAALGDSAGALASLEVGVAVRDTRMIYLKDDPNWRPLRHEPRFRALLARLKLDRFGRGLSPV
jgi:DNA-binding winged helix-turn-helix (wHTH) protein/TolB-like protein/Flp pilus assembly protein TadD